MTDLDRSTDLNPVVTNLVGASDFCTKTGRGVEDREGTDPNEVVAERNAALLGKLDLYESIVE